MIIVALSGTWQKMIQRYLGGHHSVNVVGIAQGSLSAVQLANEHHPDLMLIDSSIPFDDVIALVRNVKVENPETRSIVITDTTQQRRKITQAGADYTLSSYNFETQIGEILNQVRGTLAEATKSSNTILSVNPHTSKQSFSKKE